MDRNTFTKIGDLKTGDRFYKTGDKKKTVWEKVDGETKRTHFQTYKHFAMTDGMKFPQPMKSETSVIFLRHKDEQ